MDQPGPACASGPNGPGLQQVWGNAGMDHRPPLRTAQQRATLAEARFDRASVLMRAAACGPLPLLLLLLSEGAYSKSGARLEWTTGLTAGLGQGQYGLASPRFRESQGNVPVKGTSTPSHKGTFLGPRASPRCRETHGGAKDSTLEATWSPHSTTVFIYIIYIYIYIYIY
jgi:hypothetical protein